MGLKGSPPFVNESGNTKATNKANKYHTSWKSQRKGGRTTGDKTKHKPARFPHRKTPREATQRKGTRLQFDAGWESRRGAARGKGETQNREKILPTAGY